MIHFCQISIQNTQRIFFEFVTSFFVSIILYLLKSPAHLLLLKFQEYFEFDLVSYNCCLNYSPFFYLDEIDELFSRLKIWENIENSVEKFRSLNGFLKDANFRIYQLVYRIEIMCLNKYVSTRLLSLIPESTIYD